MSILDRVIEHDGEELTVNALRRRFTDHVTWSLRDVARAERCPTEASVLRAAALLGRGSPATVISTASWLELLDALEDAGLDAGERLDVVLTVQQSSRIPRGFHPGAAVMASCVAELTPEAAASRAAAILAGEPSREDLAVAATCLAQIPDAPLPEAVDAARFSSLPPSVARALLRRLPAERRDAILIRVLTPTNPDASWLNLESAVLLADLMVTERVRAAYRQLVKGVRGFDRKKELMDLVAAGGQTLDVMGVGPLIRPALSYWDELRAAALRARGLGPLAEHAALHRVPVSGAEALASMETWMSAAPAEREAIAARVVEALGDRFTLVGFEERGGPAIAIIAYGADELRFALVPGGAFTRGLSVAEEALIRTQSEAAGLTDSYEEYGQLVDALGTMRPLAEVHVEPFLIGQGTGEELPPEDVADWFVDSPWRLPTEAEWEYAARGGVAGALHALGATLPLEDHFLALEERGPEAKNAFCLWGFGLLPEICADVWSPSYDGAPVDGAPRTGDGPRATRGGAALVYPWQGCGEWQLLLTAMRTSQEGWDFTVGVRPTIGLRVTADPP